MVNFILGFHCHQPEGNFDFVFQEIHKKSYSPLIRTLLKYNVKFCFHVSGVLLEWLKKNDPELLSLIAKAVKSDQIELMGGGYYEPILAMVPQKDRIAQLEMLSESLFRLFGKYPQGAWITERIWQPDIIKDLKEVGLSYAFLDDFQFFQAGISPDDIDNIFRTEYDGAYLDIFPIHERLRYKLPFANPDESLNEVLYLNGRISNLSVMFDDGEKMGGWPDTHEWVYGKDGKEGWFDNFIKLANNSHLPLKFELPSSILNNTSKRVPVYLPISSYREMGEWTLPVEKRHNYEIIKSENPLAPLGGGIWHNFLTRYPEANLLHKRMLNLSYKINYAIKTYRKNLKEALNELLKSQANDAYWHGVFGGVYLPHLRRAVHKALITSYLLYKEKVKEGMEIEMYDFDMDGEKEIQLSNNCWLIIYKPSAGSFLALDYLGKGLIHSLSDVFCLHNEYDIMKLKENNFKKDGKNIDNNKENNENPPQTIHKDVKYPSDLSEKDLIIYPNLLPAFEIKFNDRQIYFKGGSVKKNKDKKSITIKTSGFLNNNLNGDNYENDDEIFTSLKIEIGKSIGFFIDSKSTASGNLDIIIRLTLPGGNGPATNIKTFGDIKGLSDYFKEELSAGVDSAVYISDSFWGGNIIIKQQAGGKFSKKYDFVFSPITTISLSESGFERIFQGIEIKYSFNLVMEEVFRSIIILDIEKIKKNNAG